MEDLIPVIVVIAVVISVIRNIAAKLKQAASGETPVVTEEERRVQEELRRMLRQNQPEAPPERPTVKPWEGSGRPVAAPVQRPIAPPSPMRPPVVVTRQVREAVEEHREAARNMEPDEHARPVVLSEAQRRMTRPEERPAAMREAARDLAEVMEQRAEKLAIKAERAGKPEPVAVTRKPALAPVKQPPPQRRTRARLGLNPRRMAHVVMLSEIWQPPLALRRDEHLKF